MKEYDADALVNAVESNEVNRNFDRGRGYNQAWRGRGCFFKDNVCTHYGNNGHNMDVCYKKHGYPLNSGAGRGNVFANIVGTEFQEVNVEMKMKGNDEENISLTQEHYKWLMDLLEKNGVDGWIHASDLVRGESNNCYSARVAGNHSNCESKSKGNDYS